MIRNYILVALRNLRRNKTYAVLNVLGLTVGVTACLLLLIIVDFQRSFDNFHANADRIYRVASQFNNEDGVSYSAGSSFPAGKALAIDFPNIRQSASIYDWGNVIVTLDGEGLLAPKKFNEDHAFFAEPSFFSIFNFPWLIGDPKQVLAAPNNVALSKTMAEKYFGNYRDAIGKTLKFDNRYSLKVAGIIQDVPANTDFPLELVISYPTMAQTNLQRNAEDWVSTFSGCQLYVVLPSNYTQAQFDRDLLAFTKKHRPAEYAKDNFVSQPLATIHTDDRFGNYNRDRTFSNSLATSLTLIGIFLIVIACVNFINLATAQAVNRSKEVGVRKVLGSSRPQLAMQFLAETAIVTFFAVIAAAFLATVVLPLLNKLLEVNMSIRILADAQWLLLMLGIAVTVVVLSGLYPAMIISGFNPITALKNKITARMVGGLSLRRVLVVMQFAIAHVLIVGTLIIVSQTDYFRNASMGFDKSSVLNVDVPGDSISTTKYDYLKTVLQQNKDIENVSLSFASPSDNGGWQSDFRFDHATKSTNFSANLKWADADYFKTYNIKFVAGKPYSPSDTIRGFVVNETLLRRFGIIDPEKAIGKEINFWDGRKVSNIVGVVSDFNSESLREPILPVVMASWKDVYQLLNIRIKPGREREVLAAVEKAWNSSFPDYVFQYEFLDKKIDAFYRQENQLAKLYKIFAAIAIFISCLGLYGLVSFMAVQRLKEVGVRKVLGASVMNIVYLFSRELTILILIAFVIAAPVAWYLMSEWLQDFTYRIRLGAGVFILSIVASLVVAWLAVGYRSVRAALVNPVKSLRSE
jgi:putative ABC transport system permease protein